MISVATDCSGIDAPIQALIQLKIPYIQKWYCDIDQFARQTAEANYPRPEKVYTDITLRNSKKLPHVDLYVCGFPCQAFSLSGKRLGTKDPRSGVIPKMLETIHYTKPKICILENVQGFKSIENGIPYKNLIEFLKKEKYNVYSDLYNTKNYGLPQNRERVYIVCIHSSVAIKEYIKPLPKKMKAFEDILIDKKIHVADIPQQYHKQLHKLHPDTKIMVSRSYYYPIKHVSITLDTTCRYNYIIKQNRLMYAKEGLLLQGFPKSFKQVVSDTQFFKQIGNTMSVNVLKEIIKEALSCINQK